MDIRTLLRVQLRQAHELFTQTAADVTPEQAQWIPPGIANPLGAIYAHAIAGEDVIVNQMLKASQPLFATTFAGKCGISEPQLNAELDWARRVRIDLPALGVYAQAVYAATDDYLASASNNELERIVAGPHGNVSVAWMVSNLVLGHVHEMMGELSCLKGIQGARGYPF